LPPRNDPENDTVSYVAFDGESAVDLSIPVMTALTHAQRSPYADLANKPGFRNAATSITTYEKLPVLGKNIANARSDSSSPA
jgi:hypothetical protein